MEMRNMPTKFEPQDLRIRPTLLLLEKIELAIVIVAAVIFLIGYASDGIFIQKFKFIHGSNSVGVWYGTKCDVNNSCISMSLQDQYEATGEIDDFDYLEIVARQVTVTIALICALCIVLLYLLVLVRQSNRCQLRIGTITFSLIAGALISEYCGIEARRQSIYKESNIDIIVEFPWSLACLGAGTVLLLIVGSICFVKELCLFKPIEETNGCRISVTWKIEFCVCVLSIILQIVGFSSNGMYISENKLTNEDVRIGVWYMTICLQNVNLSDCHTISRAQHIADLRHHGYPTADLQEANIVGFQVIFTISLCCALVSGFIYCHALYKNIVDRRTTEISLITSVLSGSFLIKACAQEARYQYLMHINSDAVYQVYVHFPWGLAVYFSGACLILVSSSICFIKLFCNSKIDRFSSGASGFGSTC